ncbi:MAG: UPF0175 family protein [Leptolyngbyaceae bacterium]|nr:UPF0175 family protein [Leptolyngbyaceae bacterium]
MGTTTIEIKIPSILLELGLDPDRVQIQVTEWMVLSLFRNTRLSSGQAAAILNLDRVEFLKLLKDYGIPYLDYSEAELIEEFQAVQELKLSSFHDRCL